MSEQVIWKLLSRPVCIFSTPPLSFLGGNLRIPFLLDSDLIARRDQLRRLEHDQSIVSCVFIENQTTWGIRSLSLHAGTGMSYAAAIQTTRFDVKWFTQAVPWRNSFLWGFPLLPMPQRHLPGHRAIRIHA